MSIPALIALLSAALVAPASEGVAGPAANPPAESGAEFCEWLNTQPGKVACGLAYPAAPAPILQSVP